MTVNDDEVPAADKLVVTMWGTYGAGMEEIAARVAELLGVALRQQAFSSEEIQAAQDSGGKDSALWFLVGATGHNPRMFDRLLPGVKKEHEKLAARMATEVLADAAQGGVIQGRTATVVLADWPKVLHVKLDGPVRDRIARAASKHNISLKDAADRQQWEDDVRSQMSIDLVDWSPLDIDLFDLVLNTIQLDTETCAQMIVAAAKVKAARLAG